jgi:hypothetical protein
MVRYRVQIRCEVFREKLMGPSHDLSLWVCSSLALSLENVQKII